MLVIILIVLLVVAVFGGGWGSSRYGRWSWSPLTIILLVLAGLYLTGNLHIG